MSSIPKFYLEKRRDKEGNLITENCLIRMYVTIPSGRVEYSTGIKVDAKHFLSDYDKKSKDPVKVSKFGHGELNDRLMAIKSEALKLIELIRVTGESLTVKEFKDRLNNKVKPNRSQENSESTFLDYLELLISQRISGKKLKRDGSRYSKGIIRKYKSLLSALQRYIIYIRRKDLPFEHINDKFYDKFKDFCFNIEGTSIGTFGNHIKDIKAIHNEAISDGFIKSKFFSERKYISPSHEPDSIALSFDHIEKISNLKLEGELDRVRDFFLIGCYTALRYSDLKLLDDAKIDNGYIRIRQQKTKGYVTIPITAKLDEIFKKYPKKFPDIEFGLHAYNTKVRKIAKMAGLTDRIILKNTSGGVIQEEEKMLCDCISSHTARRTYATNMFKLGVPTSLIMAVTGHKTELSFLRYVKATNEDKARMMSELMKKLNL